MNEKLQTRELLLLKQKKHYNCSHKVLYRENQAQQSRKQSSNHQKFGKELSSNNQ